MTKNKKIVKVTLKDLKKVVGEVIDYTGTLDKYDRGELMNTIGDFGVDQFNRGFKFGQKVDKNDRKK